MGQYREGWGEAGELCLRSATTHLLLYHPVLTGGSGTGPWAGGLRTHDLEGVCPVGSVSLEQSRGCGSLPRPGWGGTAAGPGAPSPRSSAAVVVAGHPRPHLPTSVLGAPWAHAARRTSCSHLRRHPT